MKICGRDSNDERIKGIAKVKKGCDRLILASYSICPFCGFKYPKKNKRNRAIFIFVAVEGGEFLILFFLSFLLWLRQKCKAFVTTVVSQFFTINVLTFIRYSICKLYNTQYYVCINIIHSLEFLQEQNRPLTSRLTLKI